MGRVRIRWWKLALGTSVGLLVCVGVGVQRLAFAQDKTYDVVIANGRVMDPESGLDAVRNVGIQKGKIQAISASTLKGK
ncbi:MAG TPA: hypothetical protein VH114_03225, partial [Candidatus Acidoferrum sp.]|nr:hypothetical protein [Candidatus Acidoferrum sp.]